MVLVSTISVLMMAYTISCSEMLPSEETVA